MQEITNILQISKSIKLLVKMKMYLLFNRKNHVDFLANPIKTRKQSIGIEGDLIRKQRRQTF